MGQNQCLKDYIEKLVHLFLDTVPKRFWENERNLFLQNIKPIFKKFDREVDFSEEFKFFKKLSGKNIYSTAENERIILMAHYDTPSRSLPCLSSIYRNLGFGKSRMILWVLIFIFAISAILAVAIQMNLLTAYIVYCINNDLNPDIGIAAMFISFIVAFGYLSFAPNSKNLNDNSSGVISILGILEHINLIDKSVLKYVSVAFTDAEEFGFHGAKYYKETKYNADNLVINFDGVGLGDYYRVQTTQKVDGNLKNQLNKSLDKPLINQNIKAESDFDAFDNNDMCIGINLLKKSKYNDGYYMPNMHTKNDVEIDVEHMEKFIIAMGNFIIDYVKNRENKK